MFYSRDPHVSEPELPRGQLTWSTGPPGPAVSGPARGAHGHAGAPSDASPELLRRPKAWRRAAEQLGKALEGTICRAVGCVRTSPRPRVEWWCWLRRSWPGTAPATSGRGGALRERVGKSLRAIKMSAVTRVRTRGAARIQRRRSRVLGWPRATAALTGAAPEFGR